MHAPNAFFAMGLCFLSCLVIESRATDVGAPLTRDFMAKPFVLSLVYDTSKRDIKGGGDIVSSTDDQRIMGRLAYQPHTRALLFFQAGTVAVKNDWTETSDPGTILGVGGDWTAYEQESYRGCLFANVNVANGMSAKSRVLNANGIRIILDDEQYNEYAFGLKIGKAIRADQHLSLTPYGGVMLSIIDGDHGTVTVSSNTRPDDSKKGAAYEQDGFFVAFLGLDVTLDNTITLRVEGHLLDQTGVSVAGGFCF